MFGKKKKEETTQTYLGGEFFYYHFQLDDFFQASLGTEQESNL